jgi:hypothetical protein
MIPAELALTAYRQTAFAQEIAFQHADGTAFDFTGYAGVLEVYDQFGGTSTLWLRLTTPDGGVTFPTLPTDGVLRLFVPHTAMAAVPAEGVGQYALVLEVGGVREPWLYGPFTVRDLPIDYDGGA